ncbi:glycerophosphoryl diester phosphodiesterase [Microlunatus endophyticus]|uniref:Glycerophosphoryl diester phosphodiesterase n=1 Tax=Microlunatus endophyticus TaxID=1716077 RepID=A0A917SEN0_9ACTN|nr:glycerophosphodiester phosphodiesterase family protein [Microlunatus endophyticus]GGL75256.1 glycerophosphoryl diester phosphodiesterase [Microlunatus endophyticus]
MTTNGSAASDPEIIAHRGFSGRYPESTHGSYQAAIAYAEEHDLELGLECDVHFSADDQLICLHDLDLDRTSDVTGPAFARTVDELRQVDFGSWFMPDPRPQDRMITTLVELLDMIAAARNRGVRITLNLETKHPNPRGLEVEDRVAELLTERGWAGADSPIRVITFFPDALVKLREVLPQLRRTFLISDLSRAGDGVLPDGVWIVGPDLERVREDPDWVGRMIAAGNQVHVWTVNTPADVRFCLDLGVTGFTTDFPDVVAETLSREGSDIPQYAPRVVSEDSRPGTTHRRY